MKEYIEERAIQIANYIIDENATVRQTAKRFGISKSTVHKDVTDRLIHIDPSLAAQARVVLDINKAERHIRCRPAAGWRCEREIAADCRGYFERKNLSIDKRSENCGKIRLNFRNTCDRMGAGLFLQGETRKRFLPEQPYQRQKK